MSNGADRIEPPWTPPSQLPSNHEKGAGNELRDNSLEYSREYSPDDSGDSVEELSMSEEQDKVDNDDEEVDTRPSDLVRIMSRAGIHFANGFALDDDHEPRDAPSAHGADFDTYADDDYDYPYWQRRPPTHNRTSLDELHPFVQLLSASNVDDCVEVEKAFPEAERCSRDKFLYRLNRCPELSLGLFTLPLKDDTKPKPRPTLVAHLIATRTSETLVTDRSMQLPTNWQNEILSTKDGKVIGHEVGGRTIAIHSLAVLPEHQGKRVATTLMKSYINRIQDACIADRISIIAHDNLVPFYESLGFKSQGPSECQFGGGGWVDLVLELPEEQYQK
ncbi:hypothetical protein N7495_000354 [Penicillium taxi]|uniref:uncharacterized protein n=1 Tax=Penicillium taxi TaxID=168475 RepID=UPI0025454BB4|nr:uncharacterized protein N7495_000354 [Penicillium taxi]KAJ5907672.1 hypothetical protein N7495_000354 [Penicillium taxi]